MTTAAALVPVKAFARAKVRLAPALDAPQRERLARAMAGRVVAAARPLAVWVVCDDDSVAEWAGSVGAGVMWTPGLGLNGAVDEAVTRLAAEGVERALVAHADLPLAEELAWLVPGAGATFVPDRRDDGTNVAVIPTGAGFRFAYGPGSFRRHRVEAGRVGLEVRVVREPRLRWDVDVPADLEPPDPWRMPAWT